MNISLKLFASLARSFGNFKTNIIRNEDIVIKATLGMLVANLVIYSIKCDQSYYEQEAKLNLVTADLNGLRADLVNKILLSCLDESLKDKKADRQKLIKRDLVLLIKKHSEGLPYIEQREKGAEIIVDVGPEDEKNDSAFPDDGGRIV